jgi:hypothetical protein
MKDLSALYCPDCYSRMSGEAQLTGFPETPTVDVLWYCPCCEYETTDPEWTPNWWTLNTLVNHLKWRFLKAYYAAQDNYYAAYNDRFI